MNSASDVPGSERLSTVNMPWPHRGTKPRVSSPAKVKNPLAVDVRECQANRVPPAGTCATANGSRCVYEAVPHPLALHGCPLGS